MTEEADALVAAAVRWLLSLEPVQKAIEAEIDARVEYLLEGATITIKKTPPKS